MLVLLLAWVWIGGMGAMPSRKIGLWNRFFWPRTLGEYLHRIAIRDLDRRD